MSVPQHRVSEHRVLMKRRGELTRFVLERSQRGGLGVELPPKSRPRGWESVSGYVVLVQKHCTPKNAARVPLGISPGRACRATWSRPGMIQIVMEHERGSIPLLAHKPCSKLHTHLLATHASSKGEATRRAR